MFELYEKYVYRGLSPKRWKGKTFTYLHPTKYSSNEGFFQEEGDDFSPVKIPYRYFKPYPYETINTLLTNYYKSKEFNTLRFGQWVFCNYVHDGNNWPELFYETNMEQSIDQIVQNLERIDMK